LEHCEFRDPIHGFIQVRPFERKIIDSKPFQRLRSIKQLSLTYLVYHGAEHTRFGHSLGVMHLVTRAFRTVCEKNQEYFSDKKKEWYEQILRLIALLHDLGHAPFSHGSEEVFPEGKEHEHYTYEIIKTTEIADYINEIGAGFVSKYGDEYNITPELICSIYSGTNISNPDFIFLNTFMDSELDCDKMDYLLRDSYYCGVKYGSYDLDRLLACLTMYKDHEEGFLKLAIEEGGVQAFEEFVLARYFMFIQVYFHKTRRYLDLTLVDFLKDTLPAGCYPANIDDYLNYDDGYIWSKIKAKSSMNQTALKLINRDIMKCVYQTRTHADRSDQKIYNSICNNLKREFGETNFLFDSADKMPHKIPRNYDLTDEGVIPIILQHTNMPSTIGEQSHIISTLTERINILRIYTDQSLVGQVCKRVNEMISDLNTPA